MMPRKRNSEFVSALLRQIAKAIEQLSDEDIDGLLAGGGRLSFVVEREGTVKMSGEQRTAESHEDPTVIREALGSMGSREEGSEYLRTVARRRKDLERVARCLDLPVSRGEKAERLREKIIEATIGYRLRSQAIRGGAISSDKRGGREG